MLTNIITATVTAYCACKICCGPNAKGIAANGQPPVQGRTVAAPRSIPLGSEVWINNHKYIVQDRTAKRYDGRYDIFFNSHQEALIWGKQQKQVIVITK